MGSSSANWALWKHQSLTKLTDGFSRSFCEGNEDLWLKAPEQFVADYRYMIGRQTCFSDFIDMARYIDRLDYEDWLDVDVYGLIVGAIFCTCPNMVKICGSDLSVKNLEFFETQTTKEWRMGVIYNFVQLPNHRILLRYKIHFQEVPVSYDMFKRKSVRDYLESEYRLLPERAFWKKLTEARLACEADLELAGNYQMADTWEEIKRVAAEHPGRLHFHPVSEDTLSWSTKLLVGATIAVTILPRTPSPSLEGERFVDERNEPIGGTITSESRSNALFMSEELKKLSMGTNKFDEERPGSISDPFRSNFSARDRGDKPRIAARVPVLPPKLRDDANEEEESIDDSGHKYCI